MITVNLLPHAEKQADSNPLGLKRRPLYHQMRTYDALRQYDLVMNTYNTGTGKTIASLLHLHDLNETGKNVLFIAPTNALIQQHSADIQEHVEKYGLDFKVQPITARTIRQEIEDSPRPGNVLQHFIRNYLKYEEDTHRRPLILVTNPDIYYYALFAQYGRFDQRNLFEQFMLQFDYIVIDEFHYYDSKQLANFLFILAMFDQFGYFDDPINRKICLLSATPTPHVRSYLGELFPGRWTMIAPDNEPPESKDLPTMPSLAPLSLTLIPAELNDWVAQNDHALQAWLDAGQDGAIISSSLWRVNAARQSLLPLLTERRMKRITGPEPPAARQAATRYPLILASPTVDIGYNFAKANKDRQNIDFLVCDAHFGDGLLQRIGRAGRILGKTQTDQPSHAIALLPDTAIESLKSLDGQTLTRAEFNQQINACDALPEKHRLTQYIRSHAIVECFYPIFKYGATVPPAYHYELEQLFTRVRDLFAPGGKQSYRGLKGYYFKYQKRRQWFYDTKKEIPFNHDTAVHVSDWLKWLGGAEYQPSDLQPQLSDILEYDQQQEDLRAFVQGQITITKALFNFRDSFQGPTVVVHDPRHQLSSETINSYDLFHLLRHYRLSPRLTPAQFQRQFGPTDREGDFYFQIRGWRDEKLQLAYRYQSTEERSDFAEKWCRRPVGLFGLQIQARQKGIPVHGVLDAEIVNALAAHCLPVMIITPDDVGVAIARLRGTAVWSKPLQVTFPDGGFAENYRIFFGKDAFFAHAELQTHFWLREKMKSEAIIL